MIIQRHLEALLRKSKKSVLLFGPRQTGKSTLMKLLAPELEINLAHEPTYLAFARNPSELEERLRAQSARTVFIDEIQKLPSLLNTIQTMIDETQGGIQFYLTGSSARKLRRGQANLLPGRIHTYHLGPLVASELGHPMNIKEALSTGTLPGIWTEKDVEEKQKTLRSYAATYLKEEIQAEALTRNIEGFSRFLFAVGAEAGKFLDLSKLALEAQLPYQSALRYFEILEDTLVIRRCDSFRKSIRRRLVQRPRFFFFDTGVLNGLLENFLPSQDRIGILFEHFVFNQIVDSAEAKDKPLRISSYRTEHGAEVDFIVEWEGKVFAVEAKASSTVGHSDLRGLKSFAEYYEKKHTPVILYLGSLMKVMEGVKVFPWRMFLKEIGL